MLRSKAKITFAWTPVFGVLFFRNPLVVRNIARQDYPGVNEIRVTHITKTREIFPLNYCL
jgi:hypothetical protein